MRTTLDIEPDVLDQAKALAEARRISVGKALSWLARKGSLAQTPLGERNGFSIFPVGDPAIQFGPEDVQVTLDAEDRLNARDFLNPAQPR
jgi:hypothetical protein